MIRALRTPAPDEPTVSIWLVRHREAPLLCGRHYCFEDARWLARQLNEHKTTRKAYFTVCLEE